MFEAKANKAWAEEKAVALFKHILFQCNGVTVTSCYVEILQSFFFLIYLYLLLYQTVFAGL